jgi:hypothetical protein
MAGRYFTGHKILVLFEGEAAKKFHQELFSLPDAPYRIIKGAVTGWETILSVALWSGTEPSVHDVLALMKKSDKADADLSFLEDRNLRDIFSLLCREGRFDFLRKICNTAKANVESRCMGKARVHCHLVSEEMEKIVASSL